MLGGYGGINAILSTVKAHKNNFYACYNGCVNWKNKENNEIKVEVERGGLVWETEETAW